MKSGNEQQRKREARKKRRVRNQVIAYTVMGILILALAAGIVFGVNSLLKGRRTAGGRPAGHAVGRPAGEAGYDRGVSGG